MGKPRKRHTVTAYAIPSSGKVTIAAPQLPLRALVAVRGARLEWVENVHANRTIRLKAEPTPRLKLLGGSRKLPAGMVLAVDFAATTILGVDLQTDLIVGTSFTSIRHFLPRGGGAVLASDGTGTISLPCAGDYTVSLSIGSPKLVCQPPREAWLAWAPSQDPSQGGMNPPFRVHCDRF